MPVERGESLIETEIERLPDTVRSDVALQLVQMGGRIDDISGRTDHFPVNHLVSRDQRGREKNNMRHGEQCRRARVLP